MIVSYHTLQETGFQGALCPDLALALFQNRSIAEITEEIDHCCKPQKLFSRFVSSNENKCPLLDRKFTNYEIAPIHLAAIRQNIEAVSALAGKGVNLNAKDLHGFTACHHLAIQGYAQGMKAIRALGANCNLRTHDGATAGQLLKFSAPFRDSAEWALYESASRAYHEIDPACLDPEVRIAERSVAPPQVLTDLLWSFRSFLSPEKPNLQLNHYLFENLKTFLKHPPRLRVAEIPELGQERACGLFALDPLQPGSIIGYYAGEMHMMINGEDLYGKEPDVEYLFSGQIPVDAKTYRSPAAMANDGFPNAIITPLAFDQRGVGGLPYQLALVALEPIAAGEEICIDYSDTHEIKKGGHIELRKEAILQFFAKSSLDSLIESIRSSLSLKSELDSMAVVDFAAKMMYVKQTEGTYELLRAEAGLDDADLDRLELLFKTAAQTYYNMHNTAAK